MAVPVYTTDHVPGADATAKMAAGWIVWGYAGDLANAMLLMQNTAAHDNADGIIGARISTSPDIRGNFEAVVSATTYVCYGTAFRWER